MCKSSKLPKMSQKVVFFVISIHFLAVPSLSARILGIVPTPSYSHQVAFHPLWRELSLRGHQLTVLTTDPINDPLLTNLTEIDLHASYELWNKNILEIINNFHGDFLKMCDIFISTVHSIIEQQLEHPEVQTLLKNESEHFDLLIVEYLHPTMNAFSEKFKCPFIGITSFDAPGLAYQAVANPIHPVLNPDVALPFVGKLSFLERVISSLYIPFFNYYSFMYTYPLEQLTIQKHFGKDYPQLQDIVKNVSMLFVNTDPIFHQIRPLVPAVVQIGGGTHLKPPQPLPKDLQKVLDSASEGFIYFSLGTNVKSKDLSTHTRNILLEAFAELPYKVLWKYELKNLPGKPDNVIISKWFPQQDIFRHPHIKLFITQGGQQSMEEAIYNYIPIIGMPFFGDQLNNVKKIVSKGIGLSADHKTIEKESFQKTILEVIDNPKYRNQVRELAQLALDQPMTGLERAVWWTEYVIRHKGAKHLRSPALDIPAYQYYLLDIVGFCLSVLLTVALLIVMLVRLAKYFIIRLVNYFKSKLKVKVQ